MSFEDCQCGHCRYWRMRRDSGSEPLAECSFCGEFYMKQDGVIDCDGPDEGVRVMCPRCGHDTDDEVKP